MNAANICRTGTSYLLRPCHTCATYMVLTRFLQSSSTRKKVIPMLDMWCPSGLGWMYVQRPTGLAEASQTHPTLPACGNGYGLLTRTLCSKGHAVVSSIAVWYVRGEWEKTPQGDTRTKPSRFAEQIQSLEMLGITLLLWCSSGGRNTQLGTHC